MDKPSTHLFEVEISITGLSGNEEYIELVMPAWRPGRYLIFEFSSGVQEFEAYDNSGTSLKWNKSDKSTWRVEKKSNEKIIIKYKVFANEFNLRTRGLNSEHAFINATAVFMYVNGSKGNPLTLTVIPYQNWHVTTGLDNLAADDFKFTAANYDYFADCPLEIGTQRDFEFTVRGKKHIFSIYGDAKFDKDTLISDLTKIIEYNFDFWGNIPYEKYIFITHCTPQSGGGTEHINSTVLGARKSSFETPEGYISFLRLVSHEFFHTWNVKQLKPKGLTPYDYTKENYTSELWIAEGGTSYYDGLNILRTGQYRFETFFKEISDAVQDDRRRPGNRIQSISESSFDAWVKFWRRTQNSYNSESDYYTRGFYISMILDLEIRNATGNVHSLDEVFRKMYYDFPLDKRGYTNEDFKNYSADASGISMDDFFNDYVYGTKPVDWERYLSYAGLELKSGDSTIIPVIGLRTAQQDGKIIVTDVIAGSSAESAGITYGDEIAALDGMKMGYSEMEKRVKEFNKGDKVKLTIVRNGQLIDAELPLLNTKVPNYHIEKTANPTLEQKKLYESWLGVKW